MRFMSHKISNKELEYFNDLREFLRRLLDIIFVNRLPASEKIRLIAESMDELFLEKDLAKDRDADHQDGKKD